MSKKLTASKAASKLDRIPKRILNLNGASALGKLAAATLKNIPKDDLVNITADYIGRNDPTVAASSEKQFKGASKSIQQLRDQAYGQTGGPYVVPAEILDGQTSDLTTLPRSLLAARDLRLSIGYRPSRPVKDWLYYWNPPKSMSRGNRTSEDDLGLKLDRLAELLEKLDEKNRSVANLIWSGRLKRALTKNLVDFDKDDLKNLVIDFSIVLCVITARLRMALLRHLGEAPMTSSLTSSSRWQTQGDLFKQAIHNPAKQLRQLMKDHSLVETVTSGVPLEDSLPTSHILRNPGILSVAEEVQARMYTQNLGTPNNPGVIGREMIHCG